MVEGAIVNATAFVVGSYLARYLSGEVMLMKKRGVTILPWKNIKKNIRSMKTTEQSS